MIGLSDSPDSMLPVTASPSRAQSLSASIFAPGGTLQTGLQLEHRPQQATMARAAAQAFVNDTPLLFEAGTGVGKSLAYLLPGIIHATDQNRQMIVSTHTIALQEQIDRKDLPLCRRVFAASPETKTYASFRSAVLLGKGNYLCTTRLATALRDKHELFATPEHAELQRIAAWAATSPEGLRHELSPPPPPRSLGTRQRRLLRLRPQILRLRKMLLPTRPRPHPQSPSHHRQPLPPLRPPQRRRRPRRQHPRRTFSRRLCRP